MKEMKGIGKIHNLEAFTLTENKRPRKHKRVGHWSAAFPAAMIAKRESAREILVAAQRVTE